MLIPMLILILILILYNNVLVSLYTFYDVHTSLKIHIQNVLLQVTYRLSMISTVPLLSVLRAQPQKHGQVAMKLEKLLEQSTISDWDISGKRNLERTRSKLRCFSSIGYPATKMIKIFNTGQ